MKRRALQRSASPPRSAGASLPRLMQIEKPIYGGDFLARDQGKAIFVPLVLPGETARVEIVEDKGKRGYAKAELVELVTPSPDRVAPPCPHFGLCGGCHYQHAKYEAQLEMKRQILRETLERGGVQAPEEIAVLAGEPWQYRNRIRIAFDAEGNVGYRSRRSHRIVLIRECPIAVPVLEETALAAAEFFRRAGVSSRPSELALFCDATGESVLASVFVQTPARGPEADLLDAFLRESPRVKGAELLELRGEQVLLRAQSGAGSIDYRAGEFEYRVDNGAFFQVNRWLIDSLIERVIGDASGSLAWDLFAGVGLFARQLSARFARVIAVESGASAVQSLNANLEGSAGEGLKMPVLEFLHRNANGVRPDLIVMDPPRTGLGEEMVSLLGRIAASVLVYVSCDPATLARDLKGLREGGYVIESVTLVDLFPQTFHLESVVALRRA